MLMQNGNLTNDKTSYSIETGCREFLIQMNQILMIIMYVMWQNNNRTPTQPLLVLCTVNVTRIVFRRDSLVLAVAG